MRPANWMAWTVLRRIFSRAGAMLFSHPGGIGMPRYMYVDAGSLPLLIASCTIRSAVGAVVLVAFAAATRSFALRVARACLVLYVACWGTVSGTSNWGMTVPSGRVMSTPSRLWAMPLTYRTVEYAVFSVPSILIWSPIMRAIIQLISYMAWRSANEFVKNAPSSAK